jgi:hypothetical protein
VKLFAGLLLLGTLAACGVTNSPAMTTPPASTLMTVPAVANPLDATKFLNDPCALITAGEAAGLGVPVSEKDPMAGRAACTWRKQNGSPLEVLRVQVLKDYGLAKISTECKVGCSSWATTEIASYPAIHANGPLESKYGLCRLYVGFADSSSILVTDGDLEGMQRGAGTGDAGGPKCDRADQAATLVVRKLKDGQ